VTVAWSAGVGAPQYPQVPAGFGVFIRNITLTGGVAPARAYIEQLLPDVLDGRIEPGRVFDRTISLDEVPDGYRAMADREALKVLIRPRATSHIAGPRRKRPATDLHPGAFVVQPHHSVSEGDPDGRVDERRTHPDRGSG
jgi:hypothetical protein